MPRVSDKYRDARRDEILDAARTCFLRAGFHNASMQDLFAESGLSSGAFYSYFRSKDEVIAAIAARNMLDVVELIRGVATSGRATSAGDALATILELVRAKHRREGTAGLAVEVWAEAQRNPALRTQFRASVADIGAALQSVIAQHRATGGATPEVSPEALAQAFLATITGYLLQLSLLGPTAVQSIPATVRVLWP